MPRVSLFSAKGLKASASRASGGLNPLDAREREEFCPEVASIRIGTRLEERIHLTGIEHRRGEN